MTDYQTAVSRCMELLDCKSLTENAVRKIEENLTLSDKKAPIDQALRDEFIRALTRDASLDNLVHILSTAMDLAVKDLCSASTPFTMLCDAFDSSPIAKCEEIFSFVESEIPALKSKVLFASGRNTLLRMCNDLMRRLSKSQNTVFCGRIQLFLSRLFPLDEKSGLNLMSHFNAQNVTPFNRSPTEESFAIRSKAVTSGDDVIIIDVDEGTGAEDGEAPSPAAVDGTQDGLRVDYNLYVKFWSLQDYFRYPPQLYAEQSNWDTFMTNVREVLACFRSFKLDDAASNRLRKRTAASGLGQRETFTKYLTSEKLLDLQLMDSNFRRYILVQLLIVFQYLNAHVKFKGSDQQLIDSQIEWVRQTIDEVQELIRETPPHGSEFLSTIQCVLDREEHWNAWKNEGCPSFVRAVTEENNVEVKLSRKRRGNPLWDRDGRKLCRFANADLNRIWNYCPDNMEACKDESQVFRPDLHEYFEDAIEQLDPAQKVEEEYKLVNDEGWTWRSLRLLSRRSPHFYVIWPQPGIPLRSYVISLLEKLDNEHKKPKTAEEPTPPSKGTPSKSSVNEADADESMDSTANEEGEAGKEEEDSEETSGPQSQASTPAHDAEWRPSTSERRRAAEAAADKWRSLGEELGLDTSVLDAIEDETAEGESPSLAAALQVLKVWEEGDSCRPRVLASALRSLGLRSFSEHMTSSEETK